ncbi:gfo/Idh/MocA family oxidoreductase [Clostridium tertium]|uniref:Oxidoreductase YceM n=1 Tax=Clostridium tertium TaxID=1559 RepID=A0A6N3DH36_9CLOT
MRIGVIGLGNICEKAYLPVITAIEDVELIFCTRNEEKLKRLSKKYRVSETVNTVDDLIKRKVEAAFVHTATDSHIEIIEKLLKNNIHVYVDKPISYDYEESRRVSELAKSLNKVFMVGFNRRFSPMYSRLRDSEPTIIKLQKNRVLKPKDPRIFILDDFIHVIDTVRFLAKDSIELLNVSALKKDNILYNVVVTLGNSNTTCIAIMNKDNGLNEEVLEYSTSGEKTIVKNLNNSIVASNNEEKTLNYNDWDTILYRRGFDTIIREFIMAVKSGKQPSPSIEDALESHRLCDEIIKKVIEL